MAAAATTTPPGLVMHSYRLRLSEGEFEVSLGNPVRLQLKMELRMQHRDSD